MKMPTSKDFRVTPITANDLKSAQEIIITSDGGGNESYCTVYRYNEQNQLVDVADYTNIISNIDFKNETIDVKKEREHNHRSMTVLEAVRQINTSISQHDIEQFAGTYISVRIIPKLKGYKTSLKQKNTQKRMYNPITKRYYAVRVRTSEYGKRGQIKGLWSSKKK